MSYLPHGHCASRPELPRAKLARLKLPRAKSPELQRRTLLLICGTLIAGLTPRKRLSAQEASGKSIPPSELRRSSARILPRESVTDEDDTEHDLADFRGRPTLVYLWGTWCDPCGQELPALARLAPQLDAHGVGFLSIAVNQGGPDAVRPFLAQMKLASFSTYYDRRRAIPASLEEETLPLVLLLDSDGLIVGSHAGPVRWDAPDALADLLALLRHR